MLLFLDCGPIRGIVAINPNLIGPNVVGTISYINIPQNYGPRTDERDGDFWLWSYDNSNYARTLTGD